MSKWKKSGKKILVLLLAVALAGSMLEHSQVTVTAADAEGETQGTEDPSEADEENQETEDPAKAEEASETEDSAEPEKAPETKDPAEPEEASETEDKESVSPEQTCICTATCTEETAKADCPVCKEDLSGCKPEAENAKVPESTDASGADPSDMQETPAPDSDEVLPEGEGTLDVLNLEEAAAAVRELIEALPSPEELKELDEDGQKAAYDQIQAAFDAYEELTEEQKAQFSDAEELFQELLKYFEESAILAATDDQIKGAWDAMTAAMEKREASVDLSGYQIAESDWGRIWPNVADHNPDLFYMLMATYYKNTQGIIQRVDFTYNPAYNESHVAAYKAAIQRVLDEVIRSSGSMTDEQKALALHDYLIQHMEYDQTANSNPGFEKRNAYEALVNGIGVCQGYTLAYAALLKEVGIEVDFCESGTDKMNHIWNYVKLNGNWYHVDLTYDDSTAKSSVGATGAAKHTYFLLSDSAMSKDHSWDSNSITCSDTTYDNSWHKTAPMSMSAIYTVNNAEYYLEAGMQGGVCVNTALKKRASDGTVTEIARINMEDGWTPYTMCLSRLSSSKGVIYFNVGNSVYSYNPAIANAAPAEIYKYNDGARILAGLLVTGDEMTLETWDKASSITNITVPLLTLKASEQKIKVGYTTPPVLTAIAQASSFVWAKQLPDGNWQTISGASGSSYTIETGLPAGTYSYRVTADLNGKSMVAYVTITVTEQEEQKNFAFPADTKAVTYGDENFTIAAQGAAAGSSVTYSSSDPSVATVDQKTGAVQIWKVGTTVITASASETEDYQGATCTYRLTVSKKALTWDISALEASDRLDQVKEQKATLYGELKLAGILEKDKASAEFDCPAEKLTGVYGTVAEGSQKVTLTWKDAQDTAVLQGSKAGNYAMPSALPEITGRISVVDTSLPQLPESTDGTSFKVEVQYGLSKVPDSFKDKEHLNTPGKIEQEMKLKIREKSSTIAETNIVTYDVELMINVNGAGWKKATVDNFPSSGLTITLPYPSGTGRNTHNFVVAHMFTSDMNGFRAGDVEHPKVTKTKDGIMFKVYGLSPISIGWKEAKRSSSSSGSGGSSSANTAAAPVSAVSNVNSAPTGDSSPIMLYTFFILTSLAVLTELFVRRKRSNL
ncbi:MAG: hypothetical protein HFI14_02030 [Lachnospiraceae bacterium]|nr:hypothetical protein [Lachnospiraceae bacterium]